MSNLKLESIQKWAPHAKAAPLTERNAESLAVSANGTRTCTGGWQLRYSGVIPGRAYRVEWDAESRGVDNDRDILQCTAYWGDLATDSARRRDGGVLEWEFLLPERTGPGKLRFIRILKAPENADALTLRCIFRWSVSGEAVWQLPEIEEIPARDTAQPVKIAVVTGRHGERRGRTFNTIQDNIDYYRSLCETACREENPDLIVLPEIALQWGLSGSPLDLAVPAPGPETDVFSALAQTHHTRILLGILEQDGDAVRNSAVLIGTDGQIEGKYRKVHLAVGGEMDSGILPGDSFPVFQTGIGRIGCNICMDSSAAESSRMVGLNGADFLLLPIMGDHRAWHPETHTWDPERFKSIMQTRAMDNQYCVVVAVNNTKGSCIIDRVGHILAWNEGDRPCICASLTLDDGLRPGSKGCYRGVNWMQRRPHAYGSFTDPENVGSLVAST